MVASSTNMGRDHSLAERRGDIKRPRTEGLPRFAESSLTCVGAAVPARSGSGGFDLLADVDLAALEFDDPVLQREDRVVLAEADVEAGVILRAALADDDPSGRHERP